MWDEVGASFPRHLGACVQNCVGLLILVSMAPLLPNLYAGWPG